jgi:hypothetical protein
VCNLFTSRWGAHFTDHASQTPCACETRSLDSAERN